MRERMMPALGAVFVTFSAVVVPAWAEQATNQINGSNQINGRMSGPQDSISIHNYGEFDKACIRWTDGCRNCNRGSGPFPICSSIGITCQPRNEVRCLGRINDSGNQ